jgi:hypothetical protein
MSREGPSRQLLKQRLSLFQIERVEAFSEPAVDRSEKLASRIPLALLAPKPCHGSLRRAQDFARYAIAKRGHIFQKNAIMRISMLSRVGASGGVLGSSKALCP